ESSEVQAAGDRAAVDHQRAASAQSLAAALACAVETEIVAHHFEQAVVRGDLRRNGLAIEGEGDGAVGVHFHFHVVSHSGSPPPGPASAGPMTGAAASPESITNGRGLWIP